MTGGGGGGGVGVGNQRRRLGPLGGVWGFSGGDLEVRPTGLDGFFQYKGIGVGSENQKYDLWVRLAVFQILKY